MIILIAPKGRFLSGGYLYNRRIASLQPEGQFRYLELPVVSKVPQRLSDFGISPGAHLLLDSLFFSYPEWVKALNTRHRGPLSMMLHYLPSLDPTLTLERAEMKHRAETTCLSCCNKAIATSYYLKSEVERIHSNCPEISVAPPGSEGSGEPSPRSGASSSPEGFRLLTVAHWTPAKNHRFLLPVLSELMNTPREKAPPWCWKIFGSCFEGESLVKEFRQQARTLGIEAQIQIGEEITPAEVRREMEQADLFLYPSLFESYGMTVAEALTAGLPIVANRIGGIPEVVGEPPAAVLCSGDGNTTKNRNEWHRALTHLLNVSKERRRLSRSALDRAQHLPSWQASADTIRESLETL